MDVVPQKKKLPLDLNFILTTQDLITDFVLTPANIDDREVVGESLDNYQSITNIGDKGYNNKNISPDLEKEKGIHLIFMKRDNSKKPYPKAIRQLIFKIRRRIKTVFSQLTEQLNMNRVLAKSRWGLVTRIRTKILAHNLYYFINRLLDKHINLGPIKDLTFG